MCLSDLSLVGFLQLKPAFLVHLQCQQTMQV